MWTLFRKLWIPEAEPWQLPEEVKQETKTEVDKKPKEVPAENKVKADKIEVTPPSSVAGYWFNAELRKQIHITPKGWELRSVG